MGSHQVDDRPFVYFERSKREDARATTLPRARRQPSVSAFPSRIARHGRSKMDIACALVNLGDRDYAGEMTISALRPSITMGLAIPALVAAFTAVLAFRGAPAEHRAEILRALAVFALALLARRQHSERQPPRNITPDWAFSGNVSCALSEGEASRCSIGARSVTARLRAASTNGQSPPLIASNCDCSTPRSRQGSTATSGACMADKPA